MNKQYEQVKEFHAACGIEMPDKPTTLSVGDDGSRYSINRFAEELDAITKRMKFSSSQGFGGEVLIRAGYMLEELVEFMRALTIEDQVDALCDGQYFNLGTFSLMGIKPEPMFDIVAHSNLGKIMPDGTVLRDPETGKIMKPEGWEGTYAPEPLIRAEIKRQSSPSNSYQGGD